ncbi:MAG: alkane 1-monooxygenase [Myxococcota bacterium]|jgi:alkane 1-monooxygenase
MIDARVYAASLLGPALALGAYALGVHLAVAAGILSVGCLLLDATLGDGSPESETEEGTIGRWLPRVFAPMLVAVTLLGALDFTTLGWVGQIALVAASSLYTTTFGINVAHELIHARSLGDRRLGGLMLAMLWTGSFKVEHIRGHHRDVATPADPASAPVGRSLYAHLPGAVWGNLAKGWRLETARLRRSGQGLWRHELLGWLSVSIGFTLVVGLLVGPAGAVFVVAQGILSRINLEIINYVEHYGLRREARGSGYARVSPKHSWTSERQTSRVVLLNLPRHADHHTHAARPWTMLRRIEDAPQLPAGYLAMFLFALVPPLWFRLMDSRALSHTTDLNRAQA